MSAIPGNKNKNPRSSWFSEVFALPIPSRSHMEIWGKSDLGLSVKEPSTVPELLTTSVRTVALVEIASLMVLALSKSEDIKAEDR